MKTIVSSLVATLALLVPVACAPEETVPFEEGLGPEIAARDPAVSGTFTTVTPPEPPPPGEPPPDEPPPDEPPPDQPPPDPTVDCPQVRVVGTGGEVLNVRPDASTARAPVGTLAAGQLVDVIDVVSGENVNGVSTWYEIDDGSLTGFVSGAFAECHDPADDPPPDESGFAANVFLLPLACGSTRTVTQGNNTSFSHNGGSAFAFDFGLPLNTPMMAMRAGTVAYVNESTQPGDACYDGGGQECANQANYVVIRHGDGTMTLYAHINSASVSPGDPVARGREVARSGSTGWSTGPHAHVQRMNDCGSWWCQSIAMQFGDVGGDHVPDSGQTVTSENCP